MTPTADGRRSNRHRSTALKHGGFLSRALRTNPVSALDFCTPSCAAWRMKMLHDLAAPQKVALINLIRRAHQSGALDAETTDAAVFALDDADKPILPTTPPPPPPPDAWANTPPEKRKQIADALKKTWEGLPMSDGAKKLLADLGHPVE